MEKKETANMLKWGVLAAIIAIAMPEVSIAAQATLSGAMKTAATSEMSEIPDFVSALAYVIGVILILSGALSLKKHSENPAGEPMAKGIGRLVAGGAVTGLPALTGFIRDTTTIGGTEVKYADFGSTF